jgi:hypothetical protein
MTDKFKVLQLPTQPLQKNIPLELEMAREIARENVTGELLKARFEEAGYETQLDDDGDLYVMGTWVNLRIIFYPDYASMLIRGHLSLNGELTDEELQKLSADANYRGFLVRYVAHRWDDGTTSLIGNHVMYYPFGLNMPNLIFTVRKFVETLKGFYDEHKSNEHIFPKSD